MRESWYSNPGPADPIAFTFTLKSTSHWRSVNTWTKELPLIFRCHISLELFWSVVSQTFLFLIILKVLRSTGKCFVEHPSICGMLSVFSKALDWGYGFFGKKALEVKCHSHHIISRASAIKMTQHCWFSLGHLAEVCLPDCTMVKLLPTPLLSCHILQSKSPSTAHSRWKGIVFLVSPSCLP